MTSFPSQGDRLGRASRVVVWFGAAVLMSTAYGFGIGWMMQRPVEPEGADETLPAIMIELAAEPVAVNTDDNVASVSETDSEDIKSEETQPLPEPVEEKVEPKPVDPVPEPVPVVQKEEDETPPVEEAKAEPLPEEVPEPQENPAVQEVTKVMENVAAPLPVSRPKLREIAEKPPEKKIEKRKRKPKKQTVSAQASKVAVKAKAKARQSKNNAAKVASEGRSKAVSSDKWKSRVMAHLQRHKRYPASARRQKAEGNAHVRFRIDSSGNVLSVSLARSSGFAELDRAAIAMVRNSSPVPAPPPGVNRTIVAPVYFTLQ
jgi:protein TonB